MPSAQGHLTVRRRPKDGNDGSDAVRYWLIPSATQVKRAQDGTMYPAVVTCEKRKQTGNAAPVVTNEGTLYYQIGYEDGSISGRSVYGSSGVKTTKTMAWIKFTLEVSQVEVASETVAVVADGADAYTLDLDNETQGIPCTSDGIPTGTGVLAFSNATVYRGASVDSGWTFSTEDSGCSSRINASTGALMVIAISADKATVRVTATKGTQTLRAVMSLYKVKAGNDGLSPVVYSIETSVSALRRDASGNLSPHTSVRTTDMILTYMREGQDSSETAFPVEWSEITWDASCTEVVLTLYAPDGTLLDRKSIPVIEDDGTNLITLDNEMAAILCDSAGTPAGSGVLATAKATVYNGTSVDSGWTFSKQDAGCTSTIDANGKVTVTAISADSASVRVTARKGSKTRVTTMSLYKAKAVSAGASPVAYSIEVSANAIIKDAYGTFSPTSISAYKIKTTGNSMTAYQNKTVGGVTSRVSERTLTYQRLGQDTSAITLPGEGGMIENISSACTGIRLELKNGSALLDSETVPIIKDGNHGKDAVTISVSPENVEFNYGKTETRRVTISVRKGDKALTHDANAEEHFRCSNLGTSSQLTEGLTWTSDTSNSSKFEYLLTYTKDHEVEMEIPFRVIVDGTAYERKIYVRAVKDGAQGMPGIERASLRMREWDKLEAGTEFFSGEKEGDEWTDMVYRITDAAAAGVKYWKVKKYFKKTSGQAPPAVEDEYLKATSNYDNLATAILLAHYALIKNLGAEAIEMRDSSGNIVFLAKDGTVTCNTGNFKNIHISGTSTFRGFTLKEKTEITSANHNLLTTTKNIGEGVTQTEIDLLETGNWIEVKYTPSSGYLITNLPTIRIGVAYSDAYRDYVRQFMGNEVLVYNSSSKQIAVDSGANTVTINPGFACHFRMVIAAEKMNNSGNLLERIKWEWTTPFQF